MSINDLFSLISSSGNNVNQNTSNEIIYNTNEFLEHYPMFTKYSLDMAIKKIIYLILELDIKDILKKMLLINGS